MALHLQFYMINSPRQDSDQHGNQPNLISLRCTHEESLGPYMYSYPMSTNKVANHVVNMIGFTEFLNQLNHS